LHCFEDGKVAATLRPNFLKDLPTRKSIRERHAKHLIFLNPFSYRFEGMTEMISGRLMDDLAELLNSEKFRASLRQTTFSAGLDSSTPQDTRLAAMEAENAEMKAHLKVLQTKLQGDTPGTKRNSNGKPVEKKTVPVCTACGKRGHTKEKCWDGLDAAKEKLDTAIAQRDKKKADIAKRKPSTKEAHEYVAACNKASVDAAEAAEDSKYSLPRVSLHGSRLELPATTHMCLMLCWINHSSQTRPKGTKRRRKRRLSMPSALNQRPRLQACTSMKRVSYP
jgi:hypothetical protein